MFTQEQLNAVQLSFIINTSVNILCYLTDENILQDTHECFENKYRQERKLGDQASLCFGGTAGSPSAYCELELLINFELNT